MQNISEIELNIDAKEFKKKLKIEDGKDGKDYVLTSKDKKEIASCIKVPVVEKVIEKTETIIEKPIYTNELNEDTLNEVKNIVDTKFSDINWEDIKDRPDILQLILNHISAKTYSLDDLDNVNLLGLTKDSDGKWILKDSTPQVNSDWNATSGVAEILNKPNIDDYAKLAVSITHNAFQALYVSSTLIPNQWYLITDYTTYRPIVGDLNTYHRGAVEPIYVLALDVNKVSATAYSKLYPNEILTYVDRQPITSKTFNPNATLNAGVPSGNFNLSVIDEYKIDLSDAPYPVQDGYNQSFYVSDGQSGIYFNSGNKGIDWDYDEDGNFNLITTNYPIYIYRNVEWNTNDGSIGDVAVTIEDLDRLSIDGSFDDYYWTDGFSGGQLYDAVNGWALYFDELNRGYIWDVDPLTGDIVFSNLGREMSTYLYYEDGENYGDYELLITASNEFKPDWGYPTLSPGSFYNGYTGFGITWSDETYEYFDAYNFGVTWTVVSDVVVLINNTHDLTTDLYYLEGYVYANSDSEMIDITTSEDAYIFIGLAEPSTYSPDFTTDQFIVNYSYTERVNGYIAARYNQIKDFYYDIDYRGRLIKRYALQNVGEWTSGNTYTYNQVVIKNGYYYLCFATSTTADVTNNSVWRLIGLAGNYYGSYNFTGYTGIYIPYNSNSFSYIPPFDVEAFDNTSGKFNSSVRKGSGIGLNSDLDFVILNFNNACIFDSYVYVIGSVLSQTFIRSSNIFLANSSVRDVNFTKANYINGSIISSISNSNINQISGVMSDISNCNFNAASGIIAQRITSSTFVDVTTALFAQGCTGSTINVAYNLYCEQVFGGNNILNSANTSLSQVKLLNLSPYLGVFEGNTILSTFQNVAIKSRFCRNNKFYNVISNLDLVISSFESNTISGSFIQTQLENDQTTINNNSFSGNSNLLSGNQQITLSVNNFVGTASITVGSCIFSYSGVTVPPVPGDKVTYTYKNLNINGVQQVENACVVKAVYHNSVDGTGQIVLATKRRPIDSGSLVRYSGGSFDTTINYSSVVPAISTGFDTISTPLPAIGDVYSYGGQLYYYAGKDDKHQFVGPNYVTGTLTRVTGSGASSLVTTNNQLKSSAINTSFFPSNFTAHVGTFGSGRILNSIFGTIISNDPSFQSCFAQNFNQEFELPLIVTGPYTHQLNRKSLTTTYTTSLQDDCLDCNGTFTVNLLSSATLDGKTFQFKNTGTGNITIDPFSTQTIEGEATLTLYPGEAVIIQSDNVNWNIITDGGGVPYTGAVKDVDLGNNDLIASYVYELGTYGRIYRRLFSVSTVTITTATVTKIEEFDSDGEASNVEVSNKDDNITIQKDGKYQISFTAAFKSDVDGIDFNYSLFVNGTEVELGNTITTDTKGWRTASFDGIIRLEAEDVIDVRIIQSSGGDIDLSMQNLDLNVSYLGE